MTAERDERFQAHFGSGRGRDRPKPQRPVIHLPWRTVHHHSETSMLDGVGRPAGVIRVS